MLFTAGVYIVLKYLEDIKFASWGSFSSGEKKKKRKKEKREEKKERQAQRRAAAETVARKLIEHFTHSINN